MDAVLFKLRFKVVLGEATPFAAVIAFVMVAIAVPHPVFQLCITESSAGFYHIFTVCAVVHEVACYKKYIGRLLLDSFHLLCEAISVKGGAEV